MNLTPSLLLIAESNKLENILCILAGKGVEGLPFLGIPLLGLYYFHGKYALREVVLLSLPMPYNMKRCIIGIKLQI
jgi:hypothetical protein